jgi:BT4734-like, N-terminal domain/Protein of unknown function (DUF3987)
MVLAVRGWRAATMSGENALEETTRHENERARPLVISRVLSAEDTVTRNIGVEVILEAIRTGGKNLKAQITQIRKRFKEELAITSGDLKAAKLAVEKLKKALPAVTWSGRFSYRASDKLLQHSGPLCGDLDDLGDKLPETRKKLEGSPHVFACFLSPSGDGLKVVIRVPADLSKHAGSFRAMQKHVLELTGIKPDESGKDVARLCFMSYDPELYHNPDATELEPLPERLKKKVKTNDIINLSERQRIAGELLGNIEWTSEASGYCVCPGKHRHTTRDRARDCKIELDGAPTVHCFHGHCHGILEGVSHELRSRIGKAEFEARLQTVDPQFGGSPVDQENGADLTSLSSCAVDYPAPPNEAAYYGLAGDIVRRIEPHTEADSVALLIQILTAFGNVIGRNPHALADGSRHAMNLSAVLVGKTSKARKGTAWARVCALFKRADAGWAHHCIVNGLSSGEGVIWAVRDPISKTVKGETEIVDPGVEDKRLCVVEGEFANVLKVMTREGNTLSPVLRSAWDSGNLRSLTKNSPARATDAHISIIGHITRDELRRGLTETESANGFANRFLFLGVFRSKCLPEGGGSYGVTDLVTRLHSAIKFAQPAGEVHRSDSARELWARVYPKLSEGEPGLLGAITARAEAQVLRLSCIYALLDCSATVEVDHLRAALALWRYCEDSARWIFGTGTGNKNADRILAALIVAGKKGMTRWQINNEVFNRHATKFEIDEALRLLHCLELAVRNLEGTATRRAERWIYKAQQREVCEESTLGDGETGDTSHSSHPPPSKSPSSAEPDTKAETLVGDESGESDTIQAGTYEL